MSTNIRRLGEKGQRTPRSMDIYENKGGAKGGTFCRCGVTFSKKRWRLADADFPRSESNEIVCPACRRITDSNPAGIIALSGDFFTEHETEIQSLIKKTAQKEALKNPLARLMDIHSDKDGITITTTDERLAQKIGREVYKSHGGVLHFIWSHAGSPVRVAWLR